MEITNQLDNQTYIHNIKINSMSIAICCLVFIISSAAAVTPPIQICNQQKQCQCLVHCLLCLFLFLLILYFLSLSKHFLFLFYFCFCKINVKNKSYLFPQTLHLFTFFMFSLPFSVVFLLLFMSFLFRVFVRVLPLENNIARVIYYFCPIVMRKNKNKFYLFFM